ncbi:MAG TPA: hypothetical protein VFB26_04405 [Gaiellaceae bacterium]|nr:hypothetical protein [Gaiellaceae bacterium]
MERSGAPRWIVAWLHAVSTLAAAAWGCVLGLGGGLAGGVVYVRTGSVTLAVLAAVGGVAAALVLLGLVYGGHRLARRR